jgi:hypothetical protein
MGEQGPGTNRRFPWERLILLAREERVVPVVGWGLLQVPDPDGTTVPLDRWLVRRICERGELPPGESLDAIVGRYRREGKDPADLYLLADEILRDERLPIPRALEQLASIRGFRLFVSTTIDTLIDRALRAQESKDGAETVSRAYGLEPPTGDVLDVDWRRRQRVVFRVFGEHAPDPDRFALTEEDTLEFLHRLQLDGRAAAFRHLFDFLGRSHLLFLGCGYPDWLMRFLVRTIKNERLSRSDKMKAVADDRVLYDPGLVMFLSEMHAQIYRDGPALQFVEELSRRMAAGAATPAAGAAAPAGKVFVSYAREDSKSVQTLVDSLRQHHIPVWHDRSDIGPGAEWESRIESAIQSCAAFVACISPTTERRERAEYHNEWRMAVEERKRRKPNAQFLWPVVVEPIATKMPAEVPGEFRDVHIEPCLAGAATSRLLDGLAVELRRHQTGA